MIFRVVLTCVLLATLDFASGQGFRSMFQTGRDAVKHTINAGTATVSNTLTFGNKAIQTGTNFVSGGIGKGAYAGRMAVSAGTAVAGHALAVTSNKAVNTTGKIDTLLKDVPIVGSVVKAGNNKFRQTVSSVNKVGQATLNGMDKVSEAGLSLTNKANQIGAGVVSNSAKISTGLGLATVALGSSIVQTGFDNAFTLGKNVYQQVSTGNFNVSALGNNITTGSKWIINNNSKAAFTNMLPSLNKTIAI